MTNEAHLSVLLLTVVSHSGWEKYNRFPGKDEMLKYFTWYQLNI